MNTANRFDGSDFLGMVWVVASSLGIVVGMASEARILANTGCAVVVGGGTPLGARRMAQQLVHDGATALISFGLAGGLDPALAPGTLLVPHAVLSQDERIPCSAALTAALEGERISCLLAGHEVIATADAKARLWLETGAAAVDLESGAVAEVAIANGLPFAVLRVICDPATRSLPTAAVEALDEQGRIAPMKIAGILARHPGQFIDLVALGFDAARARKALVGGAESLRRLAARDANPGGVAS